MAAADFRPRPGQIPTDPGVYRFRDGDGRVIYVGKAKSLRSRLSSYFQDPAGLHLRTAAMVATARAVDWVVVATEVEALNLEYAWIKEFDPRFNVRYRDDKSYPFLAVTVGEEFPRAMVMRGAKKPGVRYFGPYAHAWAIRETVDQLLRVFPMRTCSQGVFRRAHAAGRPCLLGYIDKCVAPCVGAVTADEHREVVEDFCSFMAGSAGAFVKERRGAMLAASRELDFERAARLRDDIFALERALERNVVVLPDGTDLDVVGLAADELEASVRIFHVRDGRIRGERGFIVERVEDADEGQLIAALLGQLYAEADTEVPRGILVPALPEGPDEAAALEAWLSQMRGRAVRLSIPRRGDRRALMDTVTRNADQALAAHKLKRSGDLTARSQALNEIAEALELPSVPLRIECFDVSNLGGDDVVASMVVFEDGLPKPSEYRKFAIKAVDGQNDVAAIAEVVRRRFRRLQAARDEEESARALSARGGELGVADRRGVGQRSAALTGAGHGSGAGSAEPAADDDVPTSGGRRHERFAYPPSLVVIDGGPPQVSAAFSELTALGLSDIAVCGLAKRLEEVWLPDDVEPVILPRASQGMYLLQRVRDEAHRTALRYQRQKRATRMTASVLDGIGGLGPVRRRALLSRFGSVRRIRAATVQELTSVPGIGGALAESVLAALAQDAPSPTVNLTTGEIVGDDVPVNAEHPR